jgi:adenylyltransferase/sulfurtransferase
MDGQIEVYNPLNDGPCVRCLWSNNTKNVLSCNESGVLGTTSGIFGILQAQEAIKFLLKQKTLKNGEILFANLLENNFYKITYKKYRNCILCSSFNKSKSLKDFYENFKQQDAQFITMNN